MIEADAWRFVVEDAQSDPDENMTTLSHSNPEEPNSIEWIRRSDQTVKNLEPLYSAETIQIAIDRLIENHEESHQKVRECDAETCEYDSTEQEHAEQEFMIVGRKQALRELKEVFSE